MDIFNVLYGDRMIEDPLEMDLTLTNLNQQISKLIEDQIVKGENDWYWLAHKEQA